MTDDELTAWNKMAGEKAGLEDELEKWKETMARNVLTECTLIPKDNHLSPLFEFTEHGAFVNLTGYHIMPSRMFNKLEQELVELEKWKADYNMECFEHIAQLEKENAELKLAVCEMFERDASAGCAFYGDEDWINVYEKLGKMAGLEV